MTEEMIDFHSKVRGRETYVGKFVKIKALLLQKRKCVQEMFQQGYLLMRDGETMLFFKERNGIFEEIESEYIAAMNDTFRD